MKKRFGSRTGYGRRVAAVLTMVLAAVMTLGGMSSVFAAGDGAAKEPYKYTVTVYAGIQGEFTGCSEGEITQGGKVWTVTKDKGAQANLGSVTLKVTNNEYYNRGYRETGHDNDENVVKPAFTVNEDVSYEVAYGLRGGMVKYIVQYEDKKGTQLHTSDEYYGMAGDKPVVSFKYIDGYQPNAYNLTKTLTGNEADNVFTFRYTKTDGSDDGEDTDGGTRDNGTVNLGATDAGETVDEEEEAEAEEERRREATVRVARTTARQVVDIVTQATQDTVAELIDLDDNASPLAGGSGDENGDQGGLGAGAIVGIGAAAVAAIGALAFALARRRRDDDDDDDDGDDGDGSGADSGSFYG